MDLGKDISNEIIPHLLCDKVVAYSLPTSQTALESGTVKLRILAILPLFPTSGYHQKYTHDYSGQGLFFLINILCSVRPIHCFLSFPHILNIKCHKKYEQSYSKFRSRNRVQLPFSHHSSHIYIWHINQFHVVAMLSIH